MVSERVKLPLKPNQVHMPQPLARRTINVWVEDEDQRHEAILLSLPPTFSMLAARGRPLVNIAFPTSEQPLKLHTISHITSLIWAHPDHGITYTRHVLPYQKAAPNVLLDSSFQLTKEMFPDLSKTSLA